MVTENLNLNWDIPTLYYPEFCPFFNTDNIIFKLTKLVYDIIYFPLQKGKTFYNMLLSAIKYTTKLKCIIAKNSSVTVRDKKVVI